MNDKLESIKKTYELFAFIRNDALREDVITPAQLRERLAALKDGEVLSVQIVQPAEE